MTSRKTTTAKETVLALPAEFDLAIEDAMVNAEELGYSEDSEAFWAEVLGQVQA